MRVLVTGANGFLGHTLTDLLSSKGYEVIATGVGNCRLPFADRPLLHYEEMNFTIPERVRFVFEKFRPDAVVHAGAQSKPDYCEMHRNLAYETNVEGTRHLLAASAITGSFFIFLSTDFIFDGERGMYREEDEPAPVNYYGITKLMAEKEVMAYQHEWAIVRTVLVYGKPLPGRPTLLGIVKDKLAKGEAYSVVNDQVRTPTHVEDLAKGILSIIDKKAPGIFHLSGKDILTPYEMACLAAEQLGLDSSLLRKVTAAVFSEPAKRPQKTGFVIEKAMKELGYQPVTFAEGLRKSFPG